MRNYFWIGALLKQSLIALMTCAGPVWAQVQQERVVQLQLQEHATLTGTHWALGQVAQVQADTPELTHSLQQQVLGRVPQLGNISHLSRAELEHALRRARPEPGLRFEWQGAQAVNLRLAQQTLQGEPLLALAQQGLEQVLQQRGVASGVSVRSVVQDVALPAGQVEVKLRALEGEAINRRMPVCLDLQVDGRFVRPVCWVFEVLHPPAVPNDRVLRGAVIPLRVAQGGVLVETRAVVQQDTLVGQIAKIKPLNDSSILKARVHSPSLLVLED